MWSQKEVDDAHATLNLFDDLERAANKPKEAKPYVPKSRRGKMV